MKVRHVRRRSNFSRMRAHLWEFPNTRVVSPKGAAASCFLGSLEATLPMSVQSCCNHFHLTLPSAGCQIILCRIASVAKRQTTPKWTADTGLQRCSRLVASQPNLRSCWRTREIKLVIFSLHSREAILVRNYLQEESWKGSRNCANIRILLRQLSCGLQFFFPAG